MQGLKRRSSSDDNDEFQPRQRREGTLEAMLAPGMEDVQAVDGEHEPLFLEEQEQEEVVELASRKILSLHVPGQNTLAAAYFDPETRKLQVLEDTKDTWAWDLAVLLVEQFQPHTVLLSSSAPDALVDVIEVYCNTNPATKYIFLPSRQFGHGMAVYHLASVRLPRNLTSLTHVSWSESGRGQASNLFDSAATSAVEGYGQDRDAGMGKVRLSLLKLGSYVNVDAPGTVCAAGALLGHIGRGLEDEVELAEDSGLELDAIESMDIDQHMFINQDALTSLAIFDIESHASMYSKTHNPGLSLDGVLNTTVTTLGQKLFRTWLLRPLLNLERINARLNAVQVLSLKQHAEPRKHVKKELKRAKNLVVCCHKIKSGRATLKEWQGLVETLAAAIDIKDTLTVMSQRRKVEVIDKLQKSLTEQVQMFMYEIINQIDWDMSKDEGRLCIRSQIDDELDQWREDYARLQPILNQMSRAMIRRVPHNLCQHLNVVYLPQLGCLVAAHDLGDVELVPQDFEQQFNTDEVTYFKTPEMHSLDEHFGDLQNIIIDREIELMQVLADHIHSVEEHILRVGDALAELDCLVALAEAVDRLDLKRPIMHEKPVLKIRNGFHPLQAMCLEQGQYIHNDTMVEGGAGGDFSPVMVVTGANGSGKSVYGKQVALITFMAHIGSFVPAERAEIGLCDKIFTRVQTRESASKAASAFMIDLNQVSHALRGATSRSLIILDEFGKGTTSSDGAGLLAGVVTHLLKGPRPRTVVLTHYHELFAQQFLDTSMGIIYCHMRSVLMDGASRLTYLYKLAPTLSMTSNAAECALHQGIPEAVVERARYVSDCLAKFQINELIDEELTPEDIRELDEAEDLTKRFLMWNLDDDDMPVLSELREILGYLEEAAEDEEEPDDAYQQAVQGSQEIDGQEDDFIVPKLEDTESEPDPGLVTELAPSP